MSPKASPVRSENRLLASLSAGDFALLRPNLTNIALDLRMELDQPNVVIKHLYFPESGMASIVADGSPDTQAEVGVVGIDGVTGLAIILGDDRSPYHTYMQIAGSGQRIKAAKFREAVAESDTLQRLFLHYAHAFTIQVAHTAAANARAKLDQKLARWILMANDRLRGDVVPITHEFLGIMLGVRRAGVTDALRVLAHRRVIRKGGLGVLIVLNRKELEKAAGRFYGVPEREYKRLIA